jgi:RecA-family ATPase
MTILAQRPPAKQTPNGHDTNCAGTGHAKKQKFNLIPFNEIKLDTASAYLVKGLIPRTGLTVIWGPPKCGKSFWAHDLIMHVALGWEYYSRRIKQGAVVYCALEGAEGFRARIEAFRQAKMAEDETEVPFYLIASPLSLVADCGTLIADIRTTLGQTIPVAVVIDTLNRSIAGSESDDRDMAMYIQGGRRSPRHVRLRRYHRSSLRHRCYAPARVYVVNRGSRCPTRRKTRPG